MLGPSFSPSMASIPGPTSSHSRYQRLRCLRARCTRERSCERAASSSVSAGAPRRGEATASGAAMHRFLPARSSGLLVCVRELDAHGVGELAADRVLALAELHEQRAAEGLAVAHLELISRRDPAIGQIPQHLGVGVRHAYEQTVVTGLQTLHAIGGGLFQLELTAANRVAVRIDRGVSELGGDQLLEILGEHVLEDLG